MSNTNSINNLQLKVWTPPEKHFVKINVDGSYIPETKKGSVGFVILWGTA